MIAQTDAIILTAIRYGLADIRKNLFLVDDIMCQFTNDPILKKIYGKGQVDRFKDFLKKEIYIMMRTRLPDSTKLPAIVIGIGGGSEDLPRQGLGDSDTFMEVDPNTLGGAVSSPRIIAGPITPINYDENTGTLTFDENTQLINIFEGQYVYDEVNKKAYVIHSVLDDFSIQIDPNLDNVNFTNMTIRPINPHVIHNYKTLFYYETYDITCISTEPNELMYLYSLVMYILVRYKKELLEKRNFELSTYGYSEIFDPTPDDDVNILYARSIQVKGRVQHSVIENTNAPLEGIDLDLLIDAEAEVPVAEETPTPQPVYEDQVKDQGWRMEKDTIYDTEDDE